MKGYLGTCWSGLCLSLLTITKTLSKVFKSACVKMNGIVSIFNNLCGNSNLDFWVYALHYCHTNWCRFQSSWCAPEPTEIPLSVSNSDTVRHQRRGAEIHLRRWMTPKHIRDARQRFFRWNYFQYNLSVWQKVLGDLLANGKYTHIWCLADSVSDSDIFSQKTRKRGTSCILPATEQLTANPPV